MTRYFLRLSDKGTVLLDDGDSQEFASLEDVQNEAIESAREILSQAVLKGKAGDTFDQHVVVLNEAGETVLTVSVRDAGDIDAAMVR
jgi:hypothetical protein